MHKGKHLLLVRCKSLMPLLGHPKWMSVLHIINLAFRSPCPIACSVWLLGMTSHYTVGNSVGLPLLGAEWDGTNVVSSSLRVLMHTGHATVWDLSQQDNWLWKEIRMTISLPNRRKCQSHQQHHNTSAWGACMGGKKHGGEKAAA